MLMSCKEKKYSYISVYWEKKSSTKKKEISLFQRQTEADFFWVWQRQNMYSRLFLWIPAVSWINISLDYFTTELWCVYVVIARVLYYAIIV